MTAAEVHEQWVESMNRGDADAFAALYAPNALVHDPAYDAPLEGRDAIREDVAAFMRAFPDLRASVRGRLDDHDTYAAHGAFEGTHDGPLATPSGEVPPSGRRVAFGGAGFYRLDGRGRILEEHRYYDLAGLLAQIGVPA